MTKPFDVSDVIYLRGLTVTDAEACLAVMVPGEGKCQPDLASALVERLMHFYSHQTFPSKASSDAVVQALTALAMEYSDNAVRRAFHPTKGLPARERFISVAAAAAVLREEEARCFRITANARHVVAEDDKRRKAAEDDTPHRTTPEERSAFVKRLLAPLKVELTRTGDTP